VEALEPGDPVRVGKYEVLGRLGSGGMGRVYLARSPGGRRVAVKLIRSELADDHHFRARFAREVTAARRVSGAFTAPVIDADPNAPQPWLVTAYIEGPSLDEAISTSGPMTADGVVALAAGLAEGLGAIHAVGVVHRDLKPSNVVLASDGPRIIDFGIARAADSTWRTGPADIIGSPGFMSPEQAEGRECGPPSDIFSLGAVLTYAVTGQGPFGDGPPEALLYRVARGRAVTDRIPAQLRPMIERCLAKDPLRRPTTDEVIAGSDALRSRAQQTRVESAASYIESPGPTISPPVNGPGKAKPGTRSFSRTFFGRRSSLAAGAAVVLAGAVAAGFILTSSPRPSPSHSTTSVTSAPVANSTAVVRAFFAAINKRDWQQVWLLGGKNLNRRPPYNTLTGMISGYRCTANDQVKELSASGQTVSGRFVAHLAHDGVATQQTYEFRYSVAHDAIKSGGQELMAGRVPPGCT
jgi:serine/threonine protein kinase